MSIRRRMTLSIMTALLLLLGSSGVLLYSYMHHQLLARFDDALLAKSTALESLLRQSSANKIEFDFSDDAMPEFIPSKYSEYFELRAADGSVIERSDSLRNADLSPAPTNSPEVRFFNTTLPDGRPGRQLVRSVTPHVGDDHGGDEDDRRTPRSAPRFLLSTARERATLDRTLITLASSIGMSAILLTLAVGVMVPWLVLHNLQPLQKMSESVGEIDPAAPGTRFPATAMPDELRPICLRLNAALERMEAAFARERRFSADVAHELQTPIAELRLISEMALRFHPDEAIVEKSFRDAHAIASQIEMIVRTLLEMSASDLPIPADQLEPVDLTALILDSWKPLGSHAAARQITLSTYPAEIPSPATSPIILGRMLSNLLNNAIEYSPIGASIQVTTAPVAGAIVLRITNPTLDLAPTDLARMSEPFWRRDPARTGTRHAGLGLSLCQCYARRLSVSISLTMPAPHIFEASMTIPHPHS